MSDYLWDEIHRLRRENDRLRGELRVGLRRAQSGSTEARARQAAADLAEHLAMVCGAEFDRYADPFEEMERVWVIFATGGEGEG